MFIGTHACIPVLTIASIDVHRLRKDKLPMLNNSQLILVGIAGILPDILWPHTSMHGRLTSWTHTIWFLILSLPTIFVISKIVYKHAYKTFTLIFWAAMAVHIFADAISGGVSLLYPVEKVFGERLIPYRTWIYYDIVFMVTTTIVLIIRYRLIKEKVDSR